MTALPENTSQSSTTKEGGRAGLSKACNHCRQAHIACEETERPCRRCVRLGLGDHCADVPARKRGRPPGTEKNTSTNSGRSQSSSSSSSSPSSCAAPPPAKKIRRTKHSPEPRPDAVVARRSAATTVDQLQRMLRQLSGLVVELAADVRSLRDSSQELDRRMTLMEAQLGLSTAGAPTTWQRQHPASYELSLTSASCRPVWLDYPQL